MESRHIEQDRWSNHNTSTRCATVVVDPGADGFYPKSRRFLQRGEVTCERVHHVDVVDGLTIVGLYEIHGDTDRIRAGIGETRHTLSYAVTGTDPVFLYVHEEATKPAQTLLGILRSSPVVVDRPFHHRTDGTLRLTLIGKDDALSRTYESLRDVFTLHLEETSDYHPEVSHLESTLTERQRHILETAVELGYYEVPRPVTHQDIADECGLSQSTVAEHLQKIEAAVLPHVVR